MAFVSLSSSFTGLGVGPRSRSRGGLCTQGSTAPKRTVVATATQPSKTSSAPVTYKASPELAKEGTAPFRGRTGIMLVNIGTPASTEVSDVREYLRQFLGDPRVVDLNPITKWLVLNLFILPNRPKESAEAYASIWDEERGSPLLFHSEDFAEKLGAAMGPKFDVAVGMQYCEPNVYTVFRQFRARGVDKVVIVPMYPQYASSSTGAAIEICYTAAAKVYSTPYLHTVPAFYDHPAYIRAYSHIIRGVIGQGCTKFDHLLMSFHGVPEQHCTKTDETSMYCQKIDNCCAQIVQANRNCYRAQSFATARRIADSLELKEGTYTIAFQSRLSAAGPEWIKPYTDYEVVNLAKAGIKRLACVVPSFTADCLETLEEIGDRAKEDFIEAGGEELVLIPCLNSEDVWVEAMQEILKDSCPMDTF